MIIHISKPKQIADRLHISRLWKSRIVGNEAMDDWHSNQCSLSLTRSSDDCSRASSTELTSVFPWGKENIAKDRSQHNSESPASHANAATEFSRAKCWRRWCWHWHSEPVDLAIWLSFSTRDKCTDLIKFKWNAYITATATECVRVCLACVSNRIEQSNSRSSSSSKLKTKSWAMLLCFCACNRMGRHNGGLLNSGKTQERKWAFETKERVKYATHTHRTRDTMTFIDGPM